MSSQISDCHDVQSLIIPIFILFEIGIESVKSILDNNWSVNIYLTVSTK